MSSGPNSDPPYCGIPTYYIPDESLGYMMNCACNATIPADPDIAGTGVMAAFIVTGWLTFFFANITSYYRLQQDFQKWKSRRIRKEEMKTLRNCGARQPNLNPQSQFEELDPEEDKPRLQTAAEKLLTSLADLQVITSLAILIAGLAQGSSLSFYHEFLIFCYWEITLNSFWVMSQLRNGKYHDVQDLPSFVRLSAVLCSVTLFLYFQLRPTLHNNSEHGSWDVLDGTRCYRLNHDHSSGKMYWFWTVGTFIYVFDLLLYVLKVPFAMILRTFWKKDGQDTRSRSVVAILREMSKFDFSNVDEELERLSKSLKDKGGFYREVDSLFRLNERFSFHCVDDWLERFFDDHNGWGRFQCFHTPLKWICRVFAFALINFIAIWSFGSANFGIETLAILGYLSWNTLDAIDAKVSNRYLIGEVSTPESGVET